MRFNQSAAVKLRNYAGEKAFAMSPEMELYAAVVTWSLSDSFYEKNDDRQTRVRELVASCDPRFVARLAIYARQKMYMRSVPLVLITELAKVHSGDDLVARACAGAIQRADEIAELLACYQVSNARRGLKKLRGLSKQIQKGLSAAFNRFDEYQFSKYNRQAVITLKDALFLVHPKAKNAAQQVVFDKIVSGKLQAAYTWESELSALGQASYPDADAKALAFKAKWEELIESRKLGYMALLRNLRNILQAGVSYESITRVCALISDPDEVKRARQFPFRYLSAYRELGVEWSLHYGQYRPAVRHSSRAQEGFTGLVLDALEKAVLTSAENIAGFDASSRLVLACDVSGSMQRPVSEGSKVMLFDVGLMLAMLLASRCKNVQTGMFGDTWRVLALPRKNVLQNVQEFYRRVGEVGYSTNGFLVIKDLLERRQKADRVMIFTDGQLWNSTGTGESMQSLWHKYRSSVAPEARLYLFDLLGYGYAEASWKWGAPDRRMERQNFRRA